MKCISLDSNDPYFNLAVDEYLLKNSRDDFMILGINDRSVVIGKHQVSHRETDPRFISTNRIPVIRRITGGGTVYHDKGNLNFSFILNSEKGKQIDFRKYTLPVIAFLESIGIDAKFEGKNDLRVGGFKISGNAEHVYKERILHHGTLLFNADLDSLSGSLRHDFRNYETRAVSSNPSPVINLYRLVSDIKNTEEFRSGMMNWFLRNYSGAEQYFLSETEKNMTGILAESKYKTWEWNYAYGPEYRFTGKIDSDGSEYSLLLNVREGIITECEINGPGSISELCKDLKGCRHMPDAVAGVIKNCNLPGPGFDTYNFF